MTIYQLTFWSLLNSYHLHFHLPHTHRFVEVKQQRTVNQPITFILALYISFIAYIIHVDLNSVATSPKFLSWVIIWYMHLRMNKWVTINFSHIRSSLENKVVSTRSTSWLVNYIDSEYLLQPDPSSFIRLTTRTKLGLYDHSKEEKKADK